MIWRFLGGTPTTQWAKDFTCHHFLLVCICVFKNTRISKLDLSKSRYFTSSNYNIWCKNRTTANVASRMKQDNLVRKLTFRSILSPNDASTPWNLAWRSRESCIVLKLLFTSLYFPKLIALSTYRRKRLQGREIILPGLSWRWNNIDGRVYERKNHVRHKPWNSTCETMKCWRLSLTIRRIYVHVLCNLFSCWRWLIFYWFIYWYFAVFVSSSSW